MLESLARRAGVLDTERLKVGFVVVSRFDRRDLGSGFFLLVVFFLIDEFLIDA